MKILHLSTSLSGGAGRSASRLANIQASEGFDVDLISSENATANSVKIERLGRELMRKAPTLFNQLITNSDYDQVSLFSVNSITVKEIFRRKPDVVHLHNYYNLIKSESFLKLGEIVPIVLTLHDERFFTGACHITQGCRNFTGNCQNCPQVSFPKSMIRKSLELQRNLIKSYRGKLEIITPSHWLRRQVESSSLPPEKYNLSVIHNLVSIPETDYASKPAGSNFRALTVSASPSLNKGLPTVINSMLGLAKANPTRKFELIIVGKNLETFLPSVPNLKITYTGVLTEVQIFSLMKETSILLVASKSENSPNIIAEAQLNDLLVLASNVGGIPEMVSNYQTGFLCEPNTASMEQMLCKILDLSTVELGKIVGNAAKVAKVRHDPHQIHLNVMSVYRRAGLEN
jgi:glycosyltransferase involved in cell wall biosynthesis